jgi:hypothetical protein
MKLRQEKSSNCVMPLLSHGRASVGRVDEEMEGAGGGQMGVCPQAVGQRARRIKPATAGPAIRESIQLRDVFLAMVLLFFARGEDHAETSGVKRKQKKTRALKLPTAGALYGG